MKILQFDTRSEAIKAMQHFRAHGLKATIRYQDGWQVRIYTSQDTQ